MGKAMKVRTDDTVKVIGGKDSGKTGRVIRTEPKRSFVYVEGLNMVKRHEKPRPVQDVQKASQQMGGIVDKEGPIHVSNVMLLDPKDNKPTRVGLRRDKGGKRERYAKRSGVSIVATHVNTFRSDGVWTRLAAPSALDDALHRLRPLVLPATPSHSSETDRISGRCH